MDWRADTAVHCCTPLLLYTIHEVSYVTIDIAHPCAARRTNNMVLPREQRALLAEAAYSCTTAVPGTVSGTVPGIMLVYHTAVYEGYRVPHCDDTWHQVLLLYVGNPDFKNRRTTRYSSIHVSQLRCGEARSTPPALTKGEAHQ